MTTLILKDRIGCVIGRITTDANGVRTLWDARGYRLGTYDPRWNTTRDAGGSIRGYGDLLALMLRSHP
jgi:hypothetical protein